MTATVTRPPTLRFATSGDRYEWECLECGAKWTRLLLDDAAKEAIRHQRVRHGETP